MEESWKKDAEAAARSAATSRIRHSRQARWQENHIRTASCKLSVEESEEFTERCREQGTTRYAVIRYMIRTYMGMEPNPIPNEADPITKSQISGKLTEITELSDQIRRNTNRIRKLLQY